MNSEHTNKTNRTKTKKLPRVMILIPPEVIMEGDPVRTGNYVGSLYIYSILREQFYGNDMDKLMYYNSFSGGLKQDELLGKLGITGKLANFGIYGVSEYDIRRKIEQFKPDIVMMPSLFSAQFPAVLYLASVVKDVNPETNVFLGGAHATGDYKYILQMPEFDLIFRSQAYRSIVEVMNAIIERRDISKIRGIAYKNEEGDVISTGFPNMFSQEEFEQLPPPAYDLLNPKQYPTTFNHWGDGDDYEGSFVDLLTIHGCPNKCYYCTTPWMHKDIILHMPLKQVKQLLEIIMDKGFNIIAELSDNIGQIYLQGSADIKEYIKQMYSLLGNWTKQGGIWLKDSGEYAFALTPEYVRMQAENGCRVVQMTYEYVDMKTMVYEARKFPIVHALNYLGVILNDKTAKSVMNPEMLSYLRSAYSIIKNVESHYPNIHAEFQVLTPRYKQFLNEIEKNGVDFSELYYHIVALANDIVHYFAMKTHGGSMIGFPMDGLTGVYKHLYYASRLRAEHGFGENPPYFLKPYPNVVLGKKYRNEVYSEFAWWRISADTTDADQLAKMIGAYAPWWLSYPVLKLNQKDNPNGEEHPVNPEILKSILVGASRGINNVSGTTLGSRRKPDTRNLGVISIEEFSEELAKRRRRLHRLITIHMKDRRKPKQRH